jgi:predicted phosphodiesterase
MNLQSKIAKEIIQEFTKDGISLLSKKKLGELLFKRHPDVYRDAEAGRTSIRLVTGANGAKKRILPENTVEWKGFKLPDPEKNDYSKVVINQKRIGILSDIHFPYYDRTALTAATNHLITFKPDCIVLNGDIIDCYQLSNFERDPRQRSFKYELDMLRNFIIQLRDLFPNTRVIFKLGNHEERYERVILNRIPELIDLELFSFANVISSKELGVEVVSNKRIMKAGHLNIGHGHEFAKGFIAPVNPARGFFMKAKSNFIGGHHHRTSEHVEQDINGKITACWSTGCLSELNPHYMPINNWNHGFATVEVDESEFMVKNLKVVKGKVV